MLFMWTLSATQINVLSEIFKSTSCPYCPSAQLGLEQLYDGHPNVIPITWYTGSTVTSPNGGARLSWYGGNGVPDARFAGNVNVVGGGGTSMYSTYLQRYNAIMSRVSPLEMSSEMDINTSNQFVVTTNVTVTANITESNNKLITVLTKHTPGSYRFLAVAYHEQAFALNQTGQSQEYTASFAMNPAWNLQDIKAVSFVQTWSGDKKVFQATQTGFSGLMSIFTADVTSGVRDLTVNFTDYSLPEGGVLEWQWDFDNDGNIDSYEQNPSYTYQEAGTYSVSLTVSDGEGTHTTTKTNMITVYDTDNVNGTAQGIWKPEYGVYHVTDDVTVPAGATLTILPGTQISFGEQKQLTVNGTLNASGTESSPILFTSDFFWKGVSILNSNNENIFKNCRFNNASSSALKINASNVLINSCFFNDNTGTATAGALDITATSTVTIEKSIFANNYATNNAGAIGISGSNVTLKNNVIVNNTGRNAGAVMAKNTSTVSIINNTIAKNTNSNTPGAQILNTGSQVSVMNSIVQGLTTIYNANGTFDISYSNLSETYEGTGNISADAMFVNPTDVDGYQGYGDYYGWKLQAGSPCIDAGNPDVQYNDVENPASPGNALYPSLGTVRNDMGAYGGNGQFNDWLSNDEESIVKPKSIVLQTYPNPFNPSVTIEFNRQNNKNELIQVNIFNIRGQKVASLFNQYSSEKSLKLTWNGQDNQGKTMPSGIYFIKASSANDTISKKVIMLK